MKQTITIVLLSLLFASSGIAQEVPEVQRTMITKITATWCPNCGSWGWTFFEDLIEDNESEKAVFFGAHHSGDLVSSPGEAFSSNFNAPYQPYFYVGNQNMDVTGGNVSSKRQEVKALVDANYLEAPIANVGFESTLTGNTLTVNVKSKFFQEATGEYYLGLYVIENGVINNQASNSSMAVHPYVLRSSFTTSDFGIEIHNGTVPAGSETTNSFTTELDGNWNLDNISIAGIIWEYNAQDDTYYFVNVNSTDELNNSTTAISQINNDVLEVAIYPTLVSSQTTLELDLKQSAQDLTIQLININGQSLATLFDGDLSTGKQHFDIPMEQYEAGIYFVHIQAADGSILTEQIIKQ